MIGQLLSLVWCAEYWDANIFCQEREQLFHLSGQLHDQVELTRYGQDMAENTPRAIQSPRARPAEKRAAAAPRNHQVSQAAHFEPQPHQPHHRAPQANPRRETIPVGYSSVESIIAISLLQNCSCSAWTCHEAAYVILRLSNTCTVWRTLAGSCRTTQGEHQAQAAVQCSGDRDPSAAV